MKKHILTLVCVTAVMITVFCSCDMLRLDAWTDPSATNTTATLPPFTTLPQITQTTAIDNPTQPTQPTTIPTPTSTTIPTPTGTTVPEIPESWPEFAITRFLTDINRNGDIAPGDGVETPGTLPTVESIPVADQSIVGETVMIVFARLQQAIPFYYACDVNTGAERLVVVVTAERIPLLLVLETQLGGANALCEKIRTQAEFPAKILAITNISYEEGNVYAYNAAYSVYGISAQEQFDIFTETDTPQNGRFMGIFGTDSAGGFLCVMKGSGEDSISAALEGNFAVFYRIFERFSLMELL